MITVFLQVPSFSYLVFILTKKYGLKGCLLFILQVIGGQMEEEGREKRGESEEENILVRGK